METIYRHAKLIKVNTGNAIPSILDIKHNNTNVKDIVLTRPIQTLIGIET